MRKARCAFCGIMKTMFVKARVFDVHKAVMKFAPQKGFTLPGYMYCGPGNALDSGQPVNELDVVCQVHNYCYETGDKRQCDADMLKNLTSVKPATFGENIAKKFSCQTSKRLEA